MSRRAEEERPGPAAAFPYDKRGSCGIASSGSAGSGGRHEVGGGERIWEVVAIGVSVLEVGDVTLAGGVRASMRGREPRGGVGGVKQKHPDLVAQVEIRSTT